MSAQYKLRCSERGSREGPHRAVRVDLSTIDSKGGELSFAAICIKVSYAQVPLLSTGAPEVECLGVKRSILVKHVHGVEQVYVEFTAKQEKRLFCAIENDRCLQMLL